MPFELESFSRFRNSEPVRLSGVDTFGLWSKPDVMRDLTIDQVTSYKVPNNRQGRVDLIATDFYGSPFYQWIIIMHNQPLNPIGWPKTGAIIEVPNIEVISSLL